MCIFSLPPLGCRCCYRNSYPYFVGFAFVFSCETLAISRCKPHFSTRLRGRPFAAVASQPKFQRNEFASTVLQCDRKRHTKFVSLRHHLLLSRSETIRLKNSILHAFDLRVGCTFFAKRSNSSIRNASPSNHSVFVRALVELSVRFDCSREIVKLQNRIRMAVHIRCDIAISHTFSCKR